MGWQAPAIANRALGTMLLLAWECLCLTGRLGNFRNWIAELPPATVSISGTAWGKIFSALKCDHDQRWAGSCANYLKGVVSYLTEARDHMIEDTRFGILIFDRVRRIAAATPLALFPPELFPLLAIRTPAALRAQEFGV